MNGFNLSAWALANRGLVVYFMVLFGIIGTWSYLNLGQSEDPPFTFKVMVVRTFWPGATSEEVNRQVTDRIEEKLQELAELDFLRSYSRPGESQVFFIVRDDLDPRGVPDVWYQVRKKIGDIRHTLPQGVVGPFFDDEFGDTFGNIYALTGIEFSFRELHDYGERIRTRLLRVRDVAKVEFFGQQDERIHVELDNVKRAALGIPAEVVLQALQAQNAVTPAGFFDTPSDRVHLRVTGALNSEHDVAQLPIHFGGRSIRLGDIATVHRGVVDPPQPRMRFNGVPTLGIGVSMAEGGDILRLGQALDEEVAKLRQALPMGMTLERVADQPRAVQRGVSEFIKVLAEAVAIVLVVSFFTLGFRTGLVVALSIPLVLAMTFAAMKLLDIDLHKISLGALVLALGLLVDDAIIAIEMMMVKLEQGWSRAKAAAAAYQITAFPMLTGTLVTAAGFLPIATAASSTGEYTRSIFQVVVIALLISWVAAVIFVPYLGYKLLPAPRHGAGQPDGTGGPGGHDPYRTRFYQRFRALVAWCVDRRWIVIALTVLAFAGSVQLFRYVPQSFFPASTRLELLVDLKLPEGASLHATEASVRRLEQLLDGEKGLEHYTAFVGSGAPRFYLPLDQQLPAPSFAQFVLMTRSLADRERLRTRLIDLFASDFPELRGRVLRLENGPPVGYPVQFRVAGDDIETVRAVAERVAGQVRANPYTANVHLDWFEPSKIVRVAVDQERLRVFGVTSADLAQFLNASLDGVQLTQLRDDNKLIDVTLRGPGAERQHLSRLDSLAVPTPSGRSVPLAQVARLEYDTEPGIIWRRDRLPTISVRADVYGSVQPPVVTAQISQALQPLMAELPPGVKLAVGGTVEESAKGQRSVMAGMPLLVLAVLTLLMFQLRSFSRTLLVVLTAPLGLIGVSVFMLALQVPFGFVAMLGTIALSGMIMRNSVILVDQIELDIAQGASQRQAIVEATVRRCRPIVLTAATAVLAMIPLSRSVFFSPMAVAIMGGLIAATALTLLFLPALYAAWFRVPRGAATRQDSPSASREGVEGARNA